MFDHPEIWKDIGYRIENGKLEPGHDVMLRRSPETSPPFLENHSPPEDLVSFKCFSSEQDQAKWVVQAIRDNLNIDKLKSSDIMVINPDPVTTRNNLGLIQSMLYEHDIAAHIAGVSTSADIFFREDRESITLTSTHRAKGNEAGMVYVVNAHENLSEGRRLGRHPQSAVYVHYP